jgi:hypothetical protein
MDFDDLADLGKHWKRSPPAHLALRRMETLLCAFFGVRQTDVGRETTDERGRPSAESIAQMVTLANGAR